jgi:hypothetical protein
MTFVEVQKEENWTMYRPYVANVLTIWASDVKNMAITDHTFGCRKLQFRTVQISKLVRQT